MARLTWALAVAAAAFPLRLAAQAAPLETDRPDFTESSSTVPCGRLQLEAGYTVRGGTRTESEHSLPEMLLRIGVGPRLELRVAQNAIAAGGSSAWDDLGLGMKLGLTAQQGGRPQLALILQTTVPTGGDRVTARTWQPSAVLLAGWALGERWSAGASAIAGRERDEHLELAGSAVVGYAIAPAWRAFAEVFTIQPVDGHAGERGESYLNGGLTRLLSPTVQLDARLGVGIGGGSVPFLAGVGLAVAW